MGTRNLTCVIDSQGEVKVAQYGQWDGYPEGQGTIVLDFLKKKGNQELLQKKLQRVRWLDKDGKDKKFVEDNDKNWPKYFGDQDNRSKRTQEIFNLFFSRDVGANILENIAESNEEGIPLKNEFDFMKDSLFCEWAYVVNFKTKKLECYTGFIHEPHSDNKYFDGSVGDEGYYPVKLLKEYDLDNLPEPGDFVDDLNRLDDKIHPQEEMK